MSAIPLLGPAPIVSEGGGTLNPKVDLCFTCTPPYKHDRVWKPDPNSPDRRRTLVVCFDGTGDSFDQDVSGSSPESLLRLGPLNDAFTEFQRRPVLGDVEERRSHKAARLLPGDFPPSNSNGTRMIPCSHPFPQAGIGTYTSDVIKTPFATSVSKLLDQMVAWNLADHIKGLSTPPRFPPSYMPDKSFQMDIYF